MPAGKGLPATVLVPASLRGPPALVLRHTARVVRCPSTSTPRRDTTRRAPSPADEPTDGPRSAAVPFGALPLVFEAGPRRIPCREAREGIPDRFLLPRGGKTILLAEDDPYFRNFVADLLEALGYRLLVARDGEEAIVLHHRHRELRIDLLLTDVVLGGVGGEGLARTLLAERTGLRVLLTSGYPRRAWEIPGCAGFLRCELPFLAKPFTATVLAEKVREVLGAA